jgi:hypothetical protein
MTRCRVHYHAGLLIYDDEVLILMDDPKRKGLGVGLKRRDGLGSKNDAASCGEPVPFGTHLAVHLDRPF